MKRILPKITFQIERWKYNKDYDLYVSNMGSVRSKDKKEQQVFVGVPSGYLATKTCQGIVNIHKLVVRTWIQDNLTGLTIDHMDSNKRNNKVSNLEVVTREENLRRAQAAALSPSKALRLTLQVREIEGLKGGRVVSFKTAEQIISLVHRIHPNAESKKILNKIYASLKNGTPYAGFNWREGQAYEGN